MGAGGGAPPGPGLADTRKGYDEAVTATVNQSPNTSALNFAAASDCMPGMMCWYTVIERRAGVAEPLADHLHRHAGLQQGIEACKPASSSEQRRSAGTTGMQAGCHSGVGASVGRIALADYGKYSSSDTAPAARPSAKLTTRAAPIIRPSRAASAA